MHEKFIECMSCGMTYPMDRIIFRCEKCKDSLEVVFDYNKLRKSVNKEKLSSRPFNHSRYMEFFPVKRLISIQEGGTFLIRSANIEKEKKLHFELYFKYEAVNPTGSFKDRGSSVEVSRAVEMKQRRVACASTGNMGASVAAYSGIAGLNCSVFIPKDTAAVKMEQILAYGSDVYHVAGDYAQTAWLVEYAFRKHGTYLLGDYLFRREGTKSIGFEIAEQLSPDYVICPIGNGTLISAAWKAFKEFRAVGFSGSLPKMIGIQASGCNPVVRAIKSGGPIKPIAGETIAIAIECGDPLDGKRAVNAIKDSKGSAHDVTDREILKARELLAKREGLFAEPGGSAALAGLLKYSGDIERGSRVVCLVTGHGLKTPKTGVTGDVVNMKNSKEAVDRIFQ